MVQFLRGAELKKVNPARAAPSIAGMSDQSSTAARNTISVLLFQHLRSRPLTRVSRKGSGRIIKRIAISNQALILHIESIQHELAVLRHKLGIAAQPPLALDIAGQ